MASKNFYFARKSTGLVRQISLFESIMLPVGVMGCFGISYTYLVYGSVFPGANLVVSALISIFLFVFFAGTYSMLSVSMPRSGGEYVFVSRILGPSAGFVTSFWFFFLTATWIGTGPAWMLRDGLNPTLWALSKATGNEALMAWTSAMNTNEVIIATSIVVLVIMTGVSLLGTRAWMRLYWALFLISIVSLLTFFGLALTNGGPTFISNFNTYSGTTVDKVLGEAAAAGFDTGGFSWSGTMLGVIFTSLSFTGFAIAVYVAGEVKEAQKSMIYSVFGGLFMFAVAAVLIYFISYQAFGIELIRALSYLWMSGNAGYPFAPFGPYPHTLSVFLTRNPVLILIIGLNFMATVLIAMLGNMIACQRALFAWAFDRLLPTKISEIDSRRGAPYVAALVTFVITVISLFLYLYTPLFQYFVYLTVSWMIVHFFVGLTGVTLPYKRKDIFEVAPGWTRKKIAGVPLVVLFGIASMIFAIILGITSIMPAYTGAPINPLYIWMIPVVFIIAIAIYGMSFALNRARGIDLGTIFKEVPPE